MLNGNSRQLPCYNEVMKQALALPVQPETQWIEPGVLPVFRTVVALQLGLSLLLMIIRTFSHEETLPLGTPLFNLGWTTLLLLYLFTTNLIGRLGRFYLPVALAFATGCTLIEYVWEMQTLFHVFGQPRLGLIIGASGWRLLIGLLAPLVIISSQYGLRTVTLFVAAILAAELAIFTWVAPQNLALLGIVLVHMVVFGLIGYIVNRTVTAQREQRQALAAANAQLAQHAATLEQLTLSRERNRLARELHDTLAHTLSAVSVQLEAVDSAWHVQPEKARELLLKSLAQTRSGLTETRRALQSLRAAPLDDLGLALAIRTLAESTAKRGGFALQLDLDEVEPLTPELEQQIYRIAQEALANVFKHSGARTVAVGLSRAKGQLTLTIEDDGRGFVVEAVQGNGHYGLRGMQERADLIDGVLEFTRGKPHGTVVRLRIPEG
jgi:signal transduction histidine kinase